MLRKTGNRRKLAVPVLATFCALVFSANAFCQAPEGTDSPDNGTQPQLVSRISESTRAQQQEGLAPRLSAEQLEIYDSWIDRAVDDLNNARLTSRSILNPREERDFWASTISKIVPQSTFQKDTLFRWALSRALKIDQILETAKSAGKPATVDQEVRVLRRSVDIALSYAQHTLLRNQDTITDLPFQDFAVAEADALLWIDENELDTEAQRAIALEVLGWMDVDLWRDPESKLMSRPIVAIGEFLKNADLHPHAVAMTDVRATYFDALTELMATPTRVGEKIKQIQLSGKTVKINRRLHL